LEKNNDGPKMMLLEITRTDGKDSFKDEFKNAAKIVEMVNRDMEEYTDTFKIHDDRVEVWEYPHEIMFDVLDKITLDGKIILNNKKLVTREYFKQKESFRGRLKRKGKRLEDRKVQEMMCKHCPSKLDTHDFNCILTCTIVQVLTELEEEEGRG
jgi:hypothetical protein